MKNRVFPFRLRSSFRSFSVVLLFLLHGCSPSVNLDGTGPEAQGTQGRGEEPEATVEITLSGRLDEAALRAALPSDDLLASDKLIAAKDLRAVFYSLNDLGKPDTVRFAFDRSFEIFRGKATGEDLEEFSFQTRTIKFKGSELIPMDDYAVVYFLSPSAELKARTVVGRRFDALTEAVALEEFMNTGILRYSTYSNLEAPVYLKKEQLRKEDPSRALDIQAAHLRALNGFVYLTADPVVGNKDYYIPQNRLFYAHLNVANKTLIPLPGKTKIVLNGGVEVFLPQDNNYNTTLLSDAGLREQFRYFSEKDLNLINYYSFTGASGATERANWVMAVPENTVSHLSLDSKTVTQVVLRVPMYPVSLLSQIGAGNKDTVEEGWLSLKDGTCYLFSDFKKEYDSILQLDEAKRTEKQREIVAAARELIAAAKGTTPDKLSASEPFVAPTTAYAGKLVKNHPSGLVFFSFPIRHFSDDKQPDTTLDGRYGVVRNTLYYYHVKSFPGLGATTFQELSGVVRKYDEEVDSQIGGAVFELPEVIFREIDL